MKNPDLKKNEQVVFPFVYPVIEKRYLTKPKAPVPVNFFDLILSRKSGRSFNELSWQKISELLWYSSKVIDTHLQDNGYILSHRPAPSAGARHPIDLLISPFSEKSGRLLYKYDPFAHSLDELSLDTGNLTFFFEHIYSLFHDGVKATIIWFVAHHNRTAAKYEHAESLVWRDAGALIYCVQLVCTALGIESCAAGSLGEPFISELFKDCESDVYGAGGLLTG